MKSKRNYNRVELLFLSLLLWCWWWWWQWRATAENGYKFSFIVLLACIHVYDATYMEALNEEMREFSLHFHNKRTQFFNILLKTCVYGVACRDDEKLIFPEKCVFLLLQCCNSSTWAPIGLQHHYEFCIKVVKWSFYIKF